MKSAATIAATILCCASTAFAAQLPFNTPPASSTPPADQLVRLTWSSKADTARAHAQLLEDGVDVWHAKPDMITARLSTASKERVMRHLAPSSVAVLLDSISAQAQADPTSWPTRQAYEDSRLAVESFQRARDSAAEMSASALTTASSYSIHDSYHPFETIEQILHDLAEEYPDYARLVSLGQSAEGRDIWGLKVTNHSFVPGESDALYSDLTTDDDDVNADKKGHKSKKIKRKIGFVIAAGQHAREWIAPASTLYMMHDLLLSTRSDASTAGSTSSLLNYLEFTFVPVTNPDGYAYTWAPDGDRLWRKNRQLVSDPASVSMNVGAQEQCYGLDLNRNWGFQFQPGTRPNPCSDAYPGSEPFEAPELSALRDYMLDKETNNVQVFLDVHSFGEMLMFPFSYSCSERAPNEENLYEAVVGAAKALRAVHGRSFETGSVCEISLTAPGDSIDWTYASAKIRWSFAVELRGGIYGFLLPSSQIRPSGEEMSAALESLGDFVVRKAQGQR